MHSSMGGHFGRTPSLFAQWISLKKL
jgi:hypothetical protein